MPIAPPVATPLTNSWRLVTVPSKSAAWANIKNWVF